MSLFQIHGISTYPTQFLDDKHALIESGTILSCLNVENGQQKFVLQLNEFDSISCIASNASQKMFAIAVQSGNGPRIEIYRYRNIDNIQLSYTFYDECSDSGYSHLDISKNGEYIIAFQMFQIYKLNFGASKSRKSYHQQISQLMI